MKQKPTRAKSLFLAHDKHNRDLQEGGQEDRKVDADRMSKHASTNGTTNIVPQSSLVSASHLLGHATLTVVSIKSVLKLTT